MVSGRMLHRWPGLRHIPRLGLVEGLTPVEPLKRLSEQLGADLWVKRDDQTNALYGGNKVRKLEYLLGDARQKGFATILTEGALGSHHVLATTLFAAQQNIRTEAILFPQSVTAHVEENLRAGLARGLLPFLEKNRRAAVARKGLRVAAHRSDGLYVIPAGGSSVIGTLGYVQCGLELAQQFLAKECPEPEAIYVALGTGGTAIGLVLGLAAAGVTAKVVGVRVTEARFMPTKDFFHLMDRTLEYLNTCEPLFPNIRDLARSLLVIDESQLGPGYAIATPAASEAMVLAKKDGLELDATYTAKAMAAMVRDARTVYPGKALLYLHTLSSAPMEPHLTGAPSIPPELLI